MTTSRRTQHLLWLLVPLVVCTTVLGPGAAAGAPSKQEVNAATAKVRRLLADVHSARSQLVHLRAQLETTTARVDAAAGRLDRVTAALLTTQQSLELAGQRYDATVSDLNDRAVAAFMGGPAQNFDFIASSASLSQVTDRMEYLSAIAESDVSLANQVATTKSELAAQQARLTDLQGQQRSALAQAQAQRAAVVGNLRQQQTLMHRIGSDLARAQAVKRRVSKAYQRELAAAAGQTVGGTHAPVPLPPGYADVFQTCPLGEPRAFTDSFGAPRYGGGYHLHKGNDIVAPMGAPIYAPFDGYASREWNVLAGNVVAVSGPSGTVYNAHLSAYSSHSSGPVHAGEVVGYVGMTGDAIDVPHDHFEFHPRVMPPSWPASPYGYSIIEDAVDPYPLLVKVCG